MKKLLLSFLVFFLGKIVFAQTVVVLDLPQPCEGYEIQENESVVSTFVVDVYPNPASESVTLSLSNSGPLGKLDVQVSDAQGNVILNKQMFSLHTELRTQLSIDGLAPGIYTVIVRLEDSISAKKLIVKK